MLRYDTWEMGLKGKVGLSNVIEATEEIIHMNKSNPEEKKSSWDKLPECEYQVMGKQTNYCG